MSIESVIPSNHLILCRPLLLLPSIFPSIRVYSNESALCMRWPKDWSFSFSISPSNEHPRLISFGMDWLDLLAIQGTLKSLLYYHSSKEHQFFGTQLYGPTLTSLHDYWKNHIYTHIYIHIYILYIYIIYINILFYNLFHYGLSQDVEYSCPCCTAGLCCLSILYITVCIC